MVKDSCKTQCLFAEWMQAGGQHRCLEHTLKLCIKNRAAIGGSEATAERLGHNCQRRCKSEYQ